MHLVEKPVRPHNVNSKLSCYNNNSEVVHSSYNNLCTDDTDQLTNSKKINAGSPSHSTSQSKQKDLQMHQNFNSKPEFCKLSSFSNEISLDDSGDAFIVSNTFDVTATIHFQKGNNSVDEISVVNKELPALPSIEMNSSDDCVDAETTYMSEDLIPFETFVDMGQF